MLEIKLTQDALSQGFVFTTQEYCKSWEKYSVVESNTKNILVTTLVKNNAERFIDYIEYGDPVPRFYSNKVKNFWRKNNASARQMPAIRGSHSLAIGEIGEDGSKELQNGTNLGENSQH